MNSTKEDRRWEAITPTEFDVLERMAKGWPNKLIADELRNSVRTVESHTQSIYSKLKVTNQVEAVVIYIQWLNDR